MTNTIHRFSSRVENYIRFRPGYPPQILDLLRKECGFGADSVVADVGSGTGKLSELFLENGSRVIGVEPNETMRAAAERLLSSYDRFVSVNGAAEDTTLAASSVDFVTAGQAFHWFDRKKARSEFARILKPKGWAVLIWNQRRLDSTPFLRDCEALLLRYGTDYQKVRHENVTGEVGPFFDPESYTFAHFDNVQQFDLEGLKGRVFSASYTPEPGNPNFEPMLHSLAEIFSKHAHNGVVEFEYDTTVYYGHLHPHTS